MMKLAATALCLTLLACTVSGQSYDFQKYNYQLLTDLSSATTCTKGVAGNTPATCPVSAGVPLTAEGKEGSTVCVTAVSGKSYEAVFSLTYPSAGIPGCTSDAECSPSGSAVPGIVCGTNGPVGVPNTCWPLAPSGCPFTGDSVVKGASSTPAQTSAPAQNTAATTPSGQSYDFQKYNYTLLTELSNATTCNKSIAGNTPATCPVDAGVPLTADGKNGSTVCVTALNGTSYETVFSLTYPSAGIPGCTSDAQCSPNSTALVGIICGTSGPVGVPNTCWPLAPSGCPFTGDSVMKPVFSPPPPAQTAVASAGRKLAL